MAKHRKLPMTHAATDHKGFTASKRRACSEPRKHCRSCAESLHATTMLNTRIQRSPSDVMSKTDLNSKALKIWPRHETGRPHETRCLRLTW